MYVCVPHACLVPTRAKRGPRVPQSGVTDGVEPLWGPWESNTGPPREHPLFLTAEPSRYYKRAFKIIPPLSCQGLYSAIFHS